jgi:tetratricopeptide (TPR) repeat protein
MRIDARWPDRLALGAMGKVMSTKTAPTAWSPAEAALLARPGRAVASARLAESAVPSGPRLRHLWQVPVFFAGLLALVLAGIAQPLFQPDEQDQLESVLVSLRQYAGGASCSLDQFLERAEPLFTQADRCPTQAAEAHYLAGCLYQSQAQKLSGKEASESWQQARRHLEQADRLGIPEGDRQRLTYRLARSWLHTGENTQRVIEAMTAAIAGADDRAEAYDLLSRAYLSLPQPDLQGALLANKKLLDLPTVKEEILAPARLLRGQLLLQLQQPGEARDVLAFVKPPAPAALVRQARYLRAQSFQEEEQWDEAAAQWKTLLTERGLEAGEQGRYLYQLGVCHRHLEELDEATRAWEQAMVKPSGEDAQAAAISLAELRLLGPNPQGALAAFEQAVHNVKKPEDWQNPLFDLTRVREVFERGCLVYHVTGRYDQSMQLALLYEKLAAPGASANLFAQAAEAEARVKRDEAAKEKVEVTRHLLAEVAHGLFRQAARKFEASAAALAPAEQGERLWRAASCYLHGEDPEAALPLLERCIQLGHPADRLDEAWFRVGEARRTTGKPAEAMAAYEQCLNIRHSGTHAYRARYQKALLHIARGEIDQAMTALEENLGLLQAEPDREAEEKCLYELGSLLIHRPEGLTMAEFRLRQALERYPDSPRALRGRFDLGACYFAQAEKEAGILREPEQTSNAAKASHRAEYQKWLQLAEKAYEGLMGLLEERLASAGTLSTEEDRLLRQSSFAAAQCRFEQGQYGRAIELYEVLAGRYRQQVESLHALAGIAKCHWAREQTALAQVAVERVRAALKEMPDDAFKDCRLTRANWEEWLQTVAKQP